MPGLNRVRGKPFRISEIQSAAEALLTGHSLEEVEVPTGDSGGPTASSGGIG